MLCLKSSVFLNVLQSIFIFLEHFYAPACCKGSKKSRSHKAIKYICIYKNITQQIAKKCVYAFHYSFFHY